MIVYVLHKLIHHLCPLPWQLWLIDTQYSLALLWGWVCSKQKDREITVGGETLWPLQSTEPTMRIVINPSATTSEGLSQISTVINSLGFKDNIQRASAQEPRQETTGSPRKHRYQTVLEQQLYNPALSGKMDPESHFCRCSSTRAASGAPARGLPWLTPRRWFPLVCRPQMTIIIITRQY